jgi:hypothetical protein
VACAAVEYDERRRGPSEHTERERRGDHHCRVPEAIPDMGRNMEKGVRRIGPRVAIALTALATVTADSHAQRAIPGAVLRAGTLSFVGHSTVGVS